MNIQELLQERYPEIAFSLNFTPFTSHSSLEELEFKNSLDEVEVLYVFGLGLYDNCLKQWLKRKGRLVLVLEDRLDVIDAFLHTEEAKPFLAAPNVCLKYVEDWEAVLEELPILYPTDRVEAAALKSYEERPDDFFKKSQLTLYRNSASISALLSEVLYSHKLFTNVYPNLLKLHAPCNRSYSSVLGSNAMQKCGAS